MPEAAAGVGGAIGRGSRDDGPATSSRGSGPSRRSGRSHPRPRAASPACRRPREAPGRRAHARRCARDRLRTDDPLGITTRAPVTGRAFLSSGTCEVTANLTKPSPARTAVTSSAARWIPGQSAWVGTTSRTTPSTSLRIEPVNVRGPVMVIVPRSEPLCLPLKVRSALQVPLTDASGVSSDSVPSMNDLPSSE